MGWPGAGATSPGAAVPGSAAPPTRGTAGARRAGPPVPMQTRLWHVEPRGGRAASLLPPCWHRGCRQARSQPSPAHRAPDPEVLGSGRARQRPRCHAGTAPLLAKAGGRKGTHALRAPRLCSGRTHGVRKIQQEGTREEKAAPRARQGSMDAPTWPQLIPNTLSGRGMLRAGPCRVPVGLVLSAVVPCRFGAGWMCGPAWNSPQGKPGGREGPCSAWH